MPFAGWKLRMAETDPTSEVLAAQWKPYVETTIEAFGADRCMFESNFPVDRFGCDYASLWNAFKRIAANYSAADKTALFSGTAKRVYRVNIA
jgi:L-fuconolactonase